jgi:hypothetical protein
MRASQITAACALAFVLFGPGAIASPRSECLASYDAAQRARKAGDLVEARTQLQRCARSDCPELVRVDCAPWLGEVEQALPSVVIRVRNAAGSDAPDARVWLDGALLQEGMQGRAIPLNPGRRRVRVESGDGRVERVIVAVQGERNRTISITLPARASGPAPGERARSEQPERDHAPPTAAWLLAGVSVVGLASFGYFALTGTRELDDLRDECAPTCTHDQLEAARRKLIVADLSLAVAVISAGAAAWLFITPSTDGASVALGASF